MGKVKEHFINTDEVFDTSLKELGDRVTPLSFLSLTDEEGGMYQPWNINEIDESYLIVISRGDWGMFFDYPHDTMVFEPKMRRKYLIYSGHLKLINKL